MLRVHDVEVSRETVRRWLLAGGLVYRRPRLVVRPKDPDRQAKLEALRGLLAGLPQDETAAFQDEVDIHGTDREIRANCDRFERATNVASHFA